MVRKSLTIWGRCGEGLIRCGGCRDATLIRRVRARLFLGDAPAEAVSLDDQIL